MNAGSRGRPLCLPIVSGSKLIIILLLILLNSKVYGLSEPQPEFANYLFESQDFYQAITEYKRFIFHHSESRLINNAYYQIGVCYKYGKKYDLARDFFEKVLPDTQPDISLKKAVCIAIAGTYIDEENFEAARFELDEAMADNSLATSDVHYWKGLTYLHEYKWKAARAEFSQVTKGSTPDKDDYLHLIQEFSPHIEEALQTSYLSEKKALLLSTIIPGSGQIYAGGAMDGIMSFIFNASMAYLTVGRVKADDYLGAGLIVSVGGLRFYHGGRQNALQMARKANEQMNLRILKAILLIADNCSDTDGRR
ncbi:tetratricopeptide repeat protein [Candidatus Desantisbacteria bacterium]|nr:tetratricopeptide repeat protein [Candidatus Desantisbacteria bacterium]